MTRRILFPTFAFAALSLLAACGGGDAPEDNAATQAKPTSIGGVGGSGLAGQGIGGVGGSGLAGQGIGGVGGSGVTAQSIGGVGGSGLAGQGIGGVGGSGIQSSAAARACGLQSVDVTIAAARVNADAGASADGPGWHTVGVAGPVRADLTRLATPGALPLDFSALPDGTYRQLRLLLVANDGAGPLADAVVAADGRETALAVPGAAQGGLALAVSIKVAQGQVAASLQGIDACKAVASADGGDALGAVADSTARVATAE